MTNAGRWLIIWIVLIMLLLMGGIICANAEETISDAMTNEEIMECYGLPEKIELHELIWWRTLQISKCLMSIL